MIKTLFLMRHADALPTERGKKDIDRKLSIEGIIEAKKNIKKIFTREEKLNYILVSTAKRTLMTQACFDQNIPIKVLPELYLAGVSTLLEMVNAIPPSVDTACVIAHNPGLSQFVHYFTGQMIEMPTASIVKIVFDYDDWNCVVAGRGVIII